ncbi:MAG: amidohydrolase family protein [Lentisphaeria bacterium]
MNIDMHVHCNSDDPAELRAFVQTCEKNETIAALSGGLHYGGHDYLPNERVLEICREFPHNLVPLAKIDLWDTVPDLWELRRYTDSGVRGFKFIYPYYGYDHENYLPVYEELEKLGFPALFHTGSYRPNTADVKYRRPILDNMSPLRLDAIARSFPKLPIIMAHLGTSLFRELAAGLVKLHPNLFFDLAGSGAFLGVSPAQLGQLMAPDVFTRDSSGLHFRKMVFGSDSYVKIPVIQTEALAAYRNILLLNNIPVEDCQAILGGTAATWLWKGKVICA